jgi:hypothetical protein
MTKKPRLVAIFSHELIAYFDKQIQLAYSLLIKHILFMSFHIYKLTQPLFFFFV